MAALAALTAPEDPETATADRRFELEVKPGRHLVVAEGDITLATADAIVNAANSSLAGGGGVDGAIHRAGGPSIMEDLERRYGPNRHCPTGRAVATIAGRLAARWVIHAVGPVWRGGRNGEPELLASAYRSALEVAAELGARSIALPAISCGIYGYPLNDAASVAVATVTEALSAGDSVVRATFVLRGSAAFDAFARSLGGLPGSRAAPP